MLIAAPAFASDRLGSGLPGHSSPSLGASGAYNNSYQNTRRREPQYNYNNSYTNAQSSRAHVPYGAYSNKWAKFNAEKNYVIINKKDCSATIYDSEGNQVKTFEVGVGKEIGDDFNDTSGLMGKAKNTTPAGEYVLIPNVFNKSAYGDITLSLGKKANKPQNSKKVVAMHKVPKFRQKDRLDKFYDGDLGNNRMSHGCINFLEKDFKELTKYIHGGLKTYVLPEEADNSLILMKNDKHKFELTQTKY